MNIKVDFDNIVVKEEKNDFNVKVLMLKGEKGDAGAGEDNIIETVQVNGTALPVSNKTVNVNVPVVDSALSSSSTNPVQNKVINSALGNKADISTLENYYQISEVDDLLSDKANSSALDNYYTKAQTYNKTEVDTFLGGKANASEITAINTALSNKANTADVANTYETITDHNASISTLSSQISSLASGRPLPASSTSDMTDTTKVYVNTSDGYWYYYDGSNWVQGGVYQATTLSDDEIEYTNLSSYMKKYFEDNIIDLKEKYLLRDTYVDLTTHVESAGVGWNTLKIPLDKDYIVEIRNNAEITMIGLLANSGTNTYGRYNIGTKSSGFNATYGVLLTSRWNSAKNFVIIPKSTTYEYLYLMITRPNEYTGDVSLYDYNTFMKENVIKYISGVDTSATNYKNKNEILDMLQVKGWYNINSTVIPSAYNQQNRAEITDISTKTKYIYIGSNSATALHVALVDEKLQNITDITTHESVVLNNTRYNKFTIAPTTGKKYALINSVLGDGETVLDVVITENEIISTGISEIEGKNIVTNNGIKKWYALGDSITETNYRSMVNYSKYVANDMNIELVNCGIGGQGYKQGTQKFISELSNIVNYNPANEIITVMGSVNDIGQMYQIPLGELGDTTDDTLYGAMYVFYNTLFTTYSGCRVGIITPIPAISYQADVHDYWKNYIKALNDTAKYFNIPILNLIDCANLRPWDSTFLTTYYTADGFGASAEVDTSGIHPNSLGHQLFYKRIEEFIKTL